MKKNKQAFLLMIAAITIISLASCTVRNHHGHRQHHDYDYAPKVNHGNQTVSLDSVYPHSLSAFN